jgi:cyclase
MRVAVVDYGIGNLRSAHRALLHLGADARLTSSVKDIEACDAVVLPGVGSFGACASALREHGFEAPLKQAITSGVPFLGICIGMQLLFEGSEESPGVKGLGILDGMVRMLPPSVKRPQMQWNRVRWPVAPSAASLRSVLLGGLEAMNEGGEFFYFVHSYAPELREQTTGVCTYGTTFTACLERNNLFATQFHPEKSSRAGLKVLGNFLSYAGMVGKESHGIASEPVVRASQRAGEPQPQGEQSLAPSYVRVIPCLDMAAGRVVKGVRFEDLKDAGDPAELALRYDTEGADEVTFLDVAASAENRDTLVNVVKRTAEQLFVPLTVGGGVRKLEDAKSLLRAGADKVSVNSAAVANPALLTEMARELGNQCVVVAIDARRRGEGVHQPEDLKELPTKGWEVYTHGGRNPTGLDALEWAQRCEEAGAGELLVTSMDADGVGAGFDIALLKAITDRVSIPVIASGGAGTPEHLLEAIQLGGADAVLAASIFHYGRYTIQEVKSYLSDNGIAVRKPAKLGDERHVGQDW